MLENYPTILDMLIASTVGIAVFPMVYLHFYKALAESKTSRALYFKRKHEYNRSGISVWSMVICQKVREKHGCIRRLILQWYNARLRPLLW